MIVGSPTILNLVPGGVTKVVHVNQVNDNIEIQFQIMNGSQPYNVTEGVSCTIRGTKGDSYGYTAEAATTVGSNVVTVTLTEQLTAVAGGCNVFELVFVGAENSMKVSTENFILAVERAALGEDTVISDSDLAYAAQVLDQLQSVGAVNAQVQQNKANIAAEVTRATAAEQTLQQNINSEASARQSADNTLQSNINVEASARATQDNVLQAEIDQLIAPSGSAPSAAEVTNARIGADGTTYDTLGNAIRRQVTDVKSHLEALAENGRYTILNPNNLFSDPTFARGLWGAQNGNIVITDKEGSLSKLATFTRVDTTTGGYLIALFPVSLFTVGKTYRISINWNRDSTSQILAIRQNSTGVIGGTKGWILTDVQMINDSHGTTKSSFHYDWTVSASDFGSYGYIQIQFKVTYDPVGFFEPFIGLADENTDYTIEFISDWALKPEMIYPINLYDGNYNEGSFYNSGNGNRVTANGFQCSKPQALNAGDYLFISNKQYFGSSAPFLYAFGTLTDINANEVLPATLIDEVVRKTGSDSITYGIYHFSIDSQKYLAFNIGRQAYDDESYFMVVRGSTIDDYPESYLAYFEPYDGVTEGVLLNQSMLDQINPLRGRKIVFDGDSICAGYGAAGGYGKIIASHNNMTYVNYAESGGTITYGTTFDGGANRHWVSGAVDDYVTDADYYIFEGGVNDVANAVTLGELSTSYDDSDFDKTTFIGALEYICCKIETLYPGKKCGYVFVHGIFNDSNYFPTWHSTYKPAMIEVFKKWGMPYIDLDSLVPPLNQISSLKSLYTNNGDGWHPNALGYNTFYVDKIAEWLKTL